jgi:hypothetical protein
MMPSAEIDRLGNEGRGGHHKAAGVTGAKAAVAPMFITVQSRSYSSWQVRALASCVATNYAFGAMSTARNQHLPG